VTRPEKRLVCRGFISKPWKIETPIAHQDVTTIMSLLGNMQHDIAWNRHLSESEFGQEEEVPEDDG
jgi:hypothetical protein